MAGDLPGLRQMHGRGMNNTSDDYKLPADVSEMDRLSLQHRTWRLLIGGLYPSHMSLQVEQLLLRTRPNGVRPTVLDVGSGSGIWAVEMAQAFPEADVTGIDLAENFRLDVPVNCRFQIGDVSRDGVLRRETYDLIHARNVIAHMRDPARVIQILQDTLRPGGILIVGEADWKTLDHDGQVMPVADEDPSHAGYHTYWGRWILEFARNVGTKTKWPFSKTVDSISQGGAFAKFGHKQYDVPIGWTPPGLRYGAEIGEMTRLNTLEFLGSGKPALLKMGVPPQTVERWAQGAHKELTEMPVKMFMPWMVAYAFKNQ